jgi:hypothetical protein
MYTPRGILSADSLAGSLTLPARPVRRKCKQSSGSFSALLGYTTEHKNLPEKRRLFWQAAGKLVFDDQPLKGI